MEVKHIYSTCHALHWFWYETGTKEKEIRTKKCESRHSWGNSQITEQEKSRNTEIRDWQTVLVQEISGLVEMSCFFLHEKPICSSQKTVSVCFYSNNTVFPEQQFLAPLIITHIQPTATLWNTRLNTYMRSRHACTYSIYIECDMSALDHF